MLKHSKFNFEIIQVVLPKIAYFTLIEYRINYTKNSSNCSPKVGGQPQVSKHTNQFDLVITDEVSNNKHRGHLILSIVKNEFE